MKPSSRNAAAAGFMLLLTIVICAAIGGGVGALLGAPELLALAGGFVGLFAGFALVYTRFRNI